jgi:hypothetical protein
MVDAIDLGLRELPLISTLAALIPAVADNGARAGFRSYSLVGVVEHRYVDLIFASAG